MSRSPYDAPRPRRTTRLTRRPGWLVAAVVSCLLVAAGPAQAAVIEDYAGYEPQTRCVKTARPGTAFLLDWLVRKHTGTHAIGTLRACTSGGASEHKDGRALDWGADATQPAQRAEVQRLLTRVFATDGVGNEHAVARRMGIMYLIWNDRIWSSYRGFEPRPYLSSGCSSRSTCSKTLRHRDHVHISLSGSGADALTSFYVRRGVPTAP